MYWCVCLVGEIRTWGGGGGEAGGVSGLVCILSVEHPSSSPVGTHLDRL